MSETQQDTANPMTALLMSQTATLYHLLDIEFEHLSIYNLADIPHVVIVLLNRPNKRNALNAKMWQEIGNVFHLIGSFGDGCRCALLVGNGKSFCAGIDTSDFHLFGHIMNDDDDDTMDVARKYLAFRPKIKEMQQCFNAIEECSIPVIAAIHGACLGGGMDLSCCADIRVCSPSAYFGIREVRLGLAADVGTIQRFPKIVGFGSRIRQLCLAGDDFGADEAFRLGFVSQMSNSDDTLLPLALRICQRIAKNSPVAVAVTKLSLNYARDHTVAEGLEHIANLNAAALMTDDLFASVVATSAGDEPSFTKLGPHARL